MGEYAKYPKNSDNEIKIGTCSSMYYLRYEQRTLIAPAISELDLARLTFRLPIPEEDHNTPGDFDFNGFYGVDATKYRIFINDENLAQELRECAAGITGNVQLSKRDAGFLVNFPCGHGQTLQDLPKGFHYNGFNSNTFALFGFGIRDGVPCVLVGCYICEKPIAWINQDELEKCQVRPAGYKQYLLDYMKKLLRSLQNRKGVFSMKYQAMNAGTCKDLQKLISSGDYIAEIKLDGFRAIAENGVFYSRLGNVLPTPIKTPKNLVLDGELIIPGGNSNDVDSALGAKGDKTLLRYVIFDILEIDGQDLTNLAWSERRAILDAYRNNIHLPLLGGDVTRPMDDIQHALRIAHDYQHEGIMLKNIHAPYQQGKRPANNWYKLKKHATADVKITGFVPGTGKNKGLVGSIAFVDENGRTGAAGGLTDAQRLEFTAAQTELIGAVMEIGYMELTKNGYRHPVFKGLRTDKKL